MNGRKLLGFSILILLSISLLPMAFHNVRATAPTIVGSNINPGSSTVTVPSGGVSYLYAATEGGSFDINSPSFTQDLSVVNNAGLHSILIGHSSNNVGSYNPNGALFPIIGGIGVSATFSSTFNSGSAGTTLVSASFTLSASALVVLATASSNNEPFLSVSSPFTVDNSASTCCGTVVFAHASLVAGSYSVSVDYTACSSPCTSDPTQMGVGLVGFVYSTSAVSGAVTYSSNTALSSDVSCTDLTINAGVTVTTNGFNFYCSGIFNNQGTVVTGTSPLQNFPSSYGGSGGGGQSNLCQAGTGAGYSTVASGGLGNSVDHVPTQGGTTPAVPTLSAALIQSWVQAGMSGFLAGAGGETVCGNIVGGAGGWGLYVQANEIIAGIVNANGQMGTGTCSGRGLSGSGGGGALLFSYGAGGYNPGSYSLQGGNGVPSCDGLSVSGAGGMGQIMVFKSVGGSSSSNWSQLNPAASPAGRGEAGMAYDAADHYTLLFGGGTTSTIFGDTWEFSGNTWTQLTASTSPSPRIFPAMVYDVADGYVLLFGGSPFGGGALSDTWKFSNGQWTQLNPSVSPTARSSAAIAYDAADGYVVLFGGVPSSGSTPYYSDTWSYKAGVWTQLGPSQAPSPRAAESMEYDAADGYVVLFGGSSNFASSGAGLGDTWKFNSGSWSQLFPISSPVSRYTYGLAYNPSVNALIMFGGWQPGGACGNTLADTWQFSGGNWVQLSPSQSPSSRQIPQMDYDGALQGVILFGGQENIGAGPFSGCGTPNILSDTWELTGGAGVSMTTLSVTASTGGAISVSSNSINGGTAVVLAPGQSRVFVVATGSSISLAALTQFGYSFSKWFLTNGVSTTPNGQAVDLSSTTITILVSSGGVAVGNFAPVGVTQPTYSVTFSELGLASGATWQVVLSSYQLSSATSTIVFTAIPAGSYAYQVSPPSGYVLITSGNAPQVQVTSNTVISLTFARSLPPLQPPAQASLSALLSPTSLIAVRTTSLLGSPSCYQAQATLSIQNTGNVQQPWNVASQGSPVSSLIVSFSSKSGSLAPGASSQASVTVKSCVTSSPPQTETLTVSGNGVLPVNIPYTVTFQGAGNTVSSPQGGKIDLQDSLVYNSTSKTYTFILSISPQAQLASTYPYFLLDSGQEASLVRSIYQQLQASQFGGLSTSSVVVSVATSDVVNDKAAMLANLILACPAAVVSGTGLATALGIGAAAFLTTSKVIADYGLTGNLLTSICAGVIPANALSIVQTIVDNEFSAISATVESKLINPYEGCISSPVSCSFQEDAVGPGQKLLVVIRGLSLPSGSGLFSTFPITVGGSNGITNFPIPTLTANCPGSITCYQISKSSFGPVTLTLQTCILHPFNSFLCFGASYASGTVTTSDPITPLIVTTVQGGLFDQLGFDSSTSTLKGDLVIANDAPGFFAANASFLIPLSLDPMNFTTFGLSENDTAISFTTTFVPGVGFLLSASFVGGGTVRLSLPRVITSVVTSIEGSHLIIIGGGYSSNSSLTIQYWNGTDWTDLPGALESTGLGDFIFSFTLPTLNERVLFVKASDTNGNVAITSIPLIQLDLATSFTDGNSNSLQLDSAGNPNLNAVLSNGKVRSTDPGQILAWTNITNTGSESFQSLQLNETLPLDWTVHPNWLPAMGGITVFYEFPNGTRMDITNVTMITVSTGNPEQISLSISNMTTTFAGQPLGPGESILLVSKLSYGLIGTSQSFASYPRTYNDSSSASAWMQPSFNGGQASASGSAFFTAYAKVNGDVNGDGVVDIIDAGMMAYAYGSRPGDARWNPALDVLNQGEINLLDVSYVYLNYGNHA